MIKQIIILIIALLIIGCSESGTSHVSCKNSGSEDCEDASSSSKETYALVEEVEIEKIQPLSTKSKSDSVKVLFNQGDSKTDYTVYDNDVFVIIYPNYWGILEQAYGANVVFVSPLISDDDTFAENVNIIIQDLSDLKWDTETYTTYSIHQIVDLSENGIILESRGIEVSGYDGHYLLSVYRVGTRVFKMLSVYAIVGEKAYLITYSAEELEYDRYIGDVEKMVNSFKILI